MSHKTEKVWVDGMFVKEVIGKWGSFLSVGIKFD